MKSSTYLYGRGFSPQVLSSLNYVEALEYKVVAAKTLVQALTEATTETTDWVRINKASQAIKFNQTLIKEAKGKDLDI